MLVNLHSDYVPQPLNCFCNGDLALSKCFSCDVFDIFVHALQAVTLDAIIWRSIQHKAFFVLIYLWALSKLPIQGGTVAPLLQSAYNLKSGNESYYCSATAPAADIVEVKKESTNNSPIDNLTVEWLSNFFPFKD